MYRIWHWRLIRSRTNMLGQLICVRSHMIFAMLNQCPGRESHTFLMCNGSIYKLLACRRRKCSNVNVWRFCLYKYIHGSLHISAARTQYLVAQPSQHACGRVALVNIYSCGCRIGFSTLRWKMGNKNKIVRKSWRPFRLLATPTTMKNELMRWTWMPNRVGSEPLLFGTSLHNIINVPKNCVHCPMWKASICHIYRCRRRKSSCRPDSTNRLLSWVQMEQQKEEKKHVDFNLDTTADGIHTHAHTHSRMKSICDLQRNAQSTRTRGRSVCEAVCVWANTCAYT